MWSLLTKCQAEQDIHTLKMAMMLSQVRRGHSRLLSNRGSAARVHGQ